MATQRRTKASAVKILRRYTDLAATIDLLTNRRITLLDPATWDDKNDSHFLQYYKENSQHKSVLALCLSSVGETYHHWKVFCDHPSGVCIEFFREPLLASLKAVKGLRHGPVRYRTLEQIAEKPPTLEQLPFIKRYAFRHELEYRLIFESKNEEMRSYPIEIPMNAIQGITLSPWMHPALLEATQRLFGTIPECKNVAINRSELISNKIWMDSAERALRGEHLSDDALSISAENPGI